MQTAVFEMTKQVYDALDDGRKPSLIFLDQATGFDSVHHNALMNTWGKSKNTFGFQHKTDLQ